MLENGRGRRVDMKRAAAFYERACALDGEAAANACARLGAAHERGRGVARNRTRARRVLQEIL